MSLNRRKFLTAAVAAGFPPPLRAPGEQPKDRLKEMKKAELPTPALLLDLDAFEANLKAMAEHCKRSGCAFRPHAKTHKCPEIGKRQVASGAVGVSVATVGEAMHMAWGGIKSILLTSPIVEDYKVFRMMEVASQAETILSVGHPRQAEKLRQVTDAFKQEVSVLIDVDVGDRRTGALPGQPALELARLLAKGKQIRVVGVQ